MVGPGVEYSIKPVNAWPELNDKTYRIIEKADRATRLRFTQELAFGRMTQEQANADHYHEVWTSTKDALGIEYRRTRK